MYKRDVNAIKTHALYNSDGLFDVIEFTLCTIQQPLHRVSLQREHIREHGSNSNFLFGSKRKGWIWASENKAYLYRVAKDILNREPSVDRDADLVQHFMQIPGLGVVKASFVAQMLGAEVACLDMHNLKRLGLPESYFKISAGLKPETLRKKVVDYIGYCAETGGSEYWWNTWCAHVAGRRGSPLKTAECVSEYHVAAVCTH